MCGFAGWLRTGTAAPAPERRLLLGRMAAQLARRGPDEETWYDDGTLALAFRRLAVIDRSGGRQPLTGESGAVLAVVNGEIYNHRALRSELSGRHRLASRSDCEVVVHLYEDDGPAMLSRLNGMFGMCVWDRERRRGMLARDRLGIKPLYYARLPDGIVFASELKALLAHPECPRDFDAGDLDLGYLGTEDYTAPNAARVPSFVRGVRVLPGGSWLPLAPGPVAEPRRYWSLEPAFAASAGPPRPARDYVAEYADLLADSIALQLGSDVGVGAFLSGGLDSSLLVAAAAASGVVGPGPGQPLECFSVSEPTTVATGDLARAADLGAALGLPFHPVRYQPGTFASSLDFGLTQLEEVVWALDAPRFAPELFFKHELHRYAKTVRPELKVILLGQGADEFAGGYSRSFSSPRPDWAAYERDALAGPAEDRAPFHREMLRRLIVLQSHNLWNEDRVAASHGIEARVPYLDHRLVEHLAAAPPELHPVLFFDKRIIRDAAARWLPRRWREAPKVLFWQAADRSSVHAIMADCARRAYPEFREAYAAGLDRLAPAELDALFVATAAPGEAGRTAVQRLLAEMTVSIFVRMCAELARGRPAPAWRPSGLELHRAVAPAALA